MKLLSRVNIARLNECCFSQITMPTIHPKIMIKVPCCNVYLCSMYYKDSSACAGGSSFYRKKKNERHRKGERVSERMIFPLQMKYFTFNRTEIDGTSIVIKLAYTLVI